MAGGFCGRWHSAVVGTVLLAFVAKSVAAVGMNATNATAAASCESEPPSWGVPVGICMGVVGSVGINVGQNLQALGMQALPEEERGSPGKSKLWRTGLATFAVFALINFSALALAPASVLTPLESIQFVTNVVFNRFVNKKLVSTMMLIGLAFTVVGTLLGVLFGAESKNCPTLETLQSYWENVGWWIFLVVTLAVAGFSQSLHTRWSKRRKAGEQLPASAAVVMPVAYTLSSALAGGSQMIVHSKVFSMLLGSMLSEGETAPLMTWLLYVEVILVVCQGGLWGFRLTECLGLYDPLLILPLMTGVYILFGGIAGGIFFQEFEVLHEGIAGPASWAFYILGMLCVVVGLGLIACASMLMEAKLYAEVGTEDAGALAEGGGAAAGGAAADRAAPKQEPPSLLVESIEDGDDEKAVEPPAPAAARAAVYVAAPSPPPPERSVIQFLAAQSAAHAPAGATKWDVARVGELVVRQRRIARVFEHDSSPCATRMPTPMACMLAARAATNLKAQLADLSQPGTVMEELILGTAALANIVKSGASSTISALTTVHGAPALLLGRLTALRRRDRVQPKPRQKPEQLVLIRAPLTDGDQGGGGLKLKPPELPARPRSETYRRER